jgi:hypothetical protein
MTGRIRPVFSHCDVQADAGFGFLLAGSYTLAVAVTVVTVVDGG